MGTEHRAKHPCSVEEAQIGEARCRDRDALRPERVRPKVSVVEMRGISNAVVTTPDGRLVGLFRRDATTHLSSFSRSIWHRVAR